LIEIVNKEANIIILMGTNLPTTRNISYSKKYILKGNKKLKKVMKKIVKILKTINLLENLYYLLMKMKKK
jgi:hypothetical protein